MLAPSVSLSLELTLSICFWVIPREGQPMNQKMKFISKPHVTHHSKEDIELFQEPKRFFNLYNFLIKLWWYKVRIEKTKKIFLNSTTFKNLKKWETSAKEKKILLGFHWCDPFSIIHGKKRYVSIYFLVITCELQRQHEHASRPSRIFEKVFSWSENCSY